MKWIEKYYHIQKKQFDTKDNIDIIYKIALPKVLGLVFSSLAATTLARSLDKRGERRKVCYWALISEVWQHLQENFISGRFSFSGDPRLGGKRKHWSSTECVKKTTTLWLTGVLANAFKNSEWDTKKCRSLQMIWNQNLEINHTNICVHEIIVGYNT